MLTNISAVTLRKAADIKDQISGLEIRLSELLNGEPARVTIHKPSGRRRMSPEARAKIAAAARARWAKAKRMGRKSL